MEPKGHETDDVDNGGPPVFKSSLEEECAKLGSSGCTVYLGKNRQFVRHKLLELHLCPELDKVHNQEGKHYDTEYEHVLRRPFNAGIVSVDSIAVVATGLTVLHGKPQGVDDVDDEQQRKTGRSYQRIPVGTQEHANLIVGCRPQQGNRIHQHVKSYE